MARFRKIYPAFWRDAKVLSLEPEAKLVALYCLCGPQANRIGLYVLSPGGGAEDCGMTPAMFLKHLDTVCHTLSWGYFENARVLYIPSWWRWNRPDNPKAFKGYLSDLDEVTESPFVQDFLSNREFLGDSLNTVLDTVCDTVSPPETETETETLSCSNRGFLSKKKAKAKKKPKPDYSTEFDELWSLYPRRVAKAEAKKAFASMRENTPFDEIGAGLKKQLPVMRAKLAEDPKFVPHLATWLRGKRWADEADAAESQQPRQKSEAELFSGMG